MIIAIPYEKEFVFDHFGKSEKFAIYDVENGEIIKKEIVDTNGAGHEMLGGFLRNLNVKVVICGGIGPGAIDFLNDSKIDVYPGNTGKCDDLVLAFINKKLEKNEATTFCCCGDDKNGCCH